MFALSFAVAGILAQIIPAPSALEVTPFHTSVHLTWSGGQRLYVIERADSGAPWWVVGHTFKPDFTDYGLSPGGMYAYRVAGADADGGPETAWSAEVHTETGVSAQGTLRIATHDLLYVIYSGGMSAGEVMRLTTAVNRDCREFYWRNSLLRYNLNITTMVIPTYPPDTSGPTMSNIAADLRSRGVQNNQYDAVFVTGNNLSGCWGGFVILGNTGGAFARGCGVPSPYEGLADSDATQDWSFVHEFGHVLDGVLCGGSGHPEMLFNHYPWAYPLPPGIQFDAGAHYDGMGELLTIYDAYDDFSAPWDGYVEVADADGDGVPDDDSRVPLDEARFGSSIVVSDTEGDGLSDFDEMTCGLYRSADPNAEDTDGDGVRDGDDPWPLVTIRPRLYRAPAAPVLDGDMDDGYHLVSTDEFFSKDPLLSHTLWGCWRDDAIYLLLKCSRRPRMWVNLDGSAENGRWDSGGKFAEGGDLYTDQAYGDCYAEDGVLVAQYGTPWVIKRGSQVPGSAQASKIVGNDYYLEIKIPTGLGPGASYSYFRTNDPLITGISLYIGKKIGFNLTLAYTYDSSVTEYSGNWATVGETYHFYDVTLADQPARLLGTVTLGQFANPEGQTATLEFRQQGTTNVLYSYPITLEADGSYEVIEVATGVYDLALKFPHFLRMVIANKPIFNHDNFAAFFQINGDADGNNTVDLGDLNEALTLFGTGDPMADLDGSGEVGLPDLNIVLLNFGLVGEP